MLKFDQFGIDVAHYRWLGRKNMAPSVESYLFGGESGGTGGVSGRQR